MFALIEGEKEKTDENSSHTKQHFTIQVTNLKNPLHFPKLST